MTIHWRKDGKRAQLYFNVADETKSTDVVIYDCKNTKEVDHALCRMGMRRRTKWQRIDSGWYEAKVRRIEKDNRSRPVFTLKLS